MTRTDVLSKAVTNCMKELYSYAVPAISWENFLKENEKFLKREKEYKALPKENRPNYKDFCGPPPFEFYYLPKKILNDICSTYVYAYKIDNQQDFIDTIKTLKDYCKEPIIDKYIPAQEDEYGWHPGYRSYDHPDNLKKEIIKILNNSNLGLTDESQNRFLAGQLQNKFFEFLDMAAGFYNYNRELNSFNCSVYLGASPHSVKETVIDNWKKYRNKDITINDNEIYEKYYGEDYIGESD